MKAWIRDKIKYICKWCNVELAEEKFDKFVQFVLFCLGGVTSAGVMYLWYIVILQLTKNYFWANLFGFFASTTNSFFWNNRIVFAEFYEKKKLIKIYFKTLLLYASTGLILSNILLYVWIECLSISAIVAPFINVIIMVPINFALNKLWAFKRT